MAETRLLRNLGWTQQKWDARHNQGAQWPVQMATAYTSLSSVQREAVKQLRISAREWDERVQAFTMGKNA